jgi:hypothetical protein
VPIFSVLLGTAFVYRGGADMAGRPWGGVLSAGLWVSLGFVKLYAHTNQPYAPYLLMSAGLVVCAGRFWRGGARRGVFIGLVLFTAGALYTFYPTIYLILALNLYALGRLWRKPALYQRWFMAQALAGLLYLPWLPVLLPFINGEYSALIAAGGIGDFGFGESSLGTSMPSNLNTLLETWRSFFYESPLFFAGLVGLALLRRPRAAGLLVAIVVLGLGVALLANLALQTYLPRRVLFALVPLCLLMGAGLGRWPRGVGGAALAMMLALTWNAPTPAGWIGNQYFRHGMEAVAEECRPQDMVWVYFSGRFEALPFRYYAERILPTSLPAYLQKDDPAALDVAASLRARLWVLWADNAPPLLTPAMQERGYMLRQTKRVGWFNVSLYDAPPPPPLMGARAVFGGRFALHSAYLLDLGDTGQLNLSWSCRADCTPPRHDRAPANLPPDVVVYVHLLNAEGALVAAFDAPITHVGRVIPLAVWGENLPAQDRRTLDLRSLAEGQTYQVKVGLYRLADGMRLHTESNADGLIVARIRR